MSVSSGRHVALLRGINVGRNKRVAMADLRSLVEKLGYRDVRTLLNSGNVVFGAPAGMRGDHAKRIEEAIGKTLGVASRVTVLSAEEVARVIAENTLLEVATNPSRLLVFVLSDPGDRRNLATLLRRDWGKESVALGSRSLYTWCPEGMLESPLTTAVGRVLGDRTTSRNWATFQKLAALLAEGS